jgi:hypothetical protein
MTAGRAAPAFQLRIPVPVPRFLDSASLAVPVPRSLDSASLAVPVPRFLDSASLAVPCPDSPTPHPRTSTHTSHKRLFE